MIPYTRHHVEPSDLCAVERVLSSTHLAQGPEAVRFEDALAQVVGAQHAVSLSSGTAALHIALAALGVGPGDEVIVPSLTFVATANAVMLCGARPVFADVERRSLNLCAASVAGLAGPRTRGVIAVHYAGAPADVPAIRESVGEGAFLLEDASHALGAQLAGVPVGSLGDAATFSFHPAKHVTTGEGGAVTCRRPELATRARRLREHGIERRPERFRGLGLPSSLRVEEEGAWVYEMHELGLNYRLPEACAALGRSQLCRLESQLVRRREIASFYRSAFEEIEEVEVLVEESNSRSAWHLYPIRLELDRLRVGRAAVFRELRERGLGVQVHYIPVHLQPFYRDRLGTGFGDLPSTETEYMRLISLPMHPGLSQSELDHVVESVRDVLGKYRR